MTCYGMNSARRSAPRACISWTRSSATGTFITRLLQSGLIAPDELERKYREEIHCNELVLLAYYIAAINIETVFHAVAGRDDYLPFEGICLTDSFALHEGDDELSFLYEGTTQTDESGRRRQTFGCFSEIRLTRPAKGARTTTPRMSAYSGLDQKIRSTYAERSRAGLSQGLYDSYIRAIRWGSDRLGGAGVMAYVSGGAWVERAFADGMRRCLADDFASIHVFHLRGDIRKNMLSGGTVPEKARTCSVREA